MNERVRSHMSLQPRSTKSEKLRLAINRSSSFFVFIIIQAVFIISVILDITLARQVLGFISLTFLPGFCVLKLLKMDEISLAETLLFSVALSIVIIEIVGLLANNILYFLGVSTPLSEHILMPLVTIIFVMLCFFAFFQKGHLSFKLPIASACRRKTMILTILLFTLPALSIIGTFLVSNLGHNFFTLSIVIIMVILLLIISFQETHNQLYPLILLSFAFALLFLGGLISNYITGFDIHREYYVFTKTLEDHLWNPIHFPGDLFHVYSSFNSMLSDTILPTIYSVLLRMEPTWVLKIVFPIIYAHVPLSLYVLHSSQTGKFVAFISTMFFMSNFDVYLQPLANSKQMIAMLFLVLLFIMLFKRKIAPLSRMLCLIFFSVGLITAHYATSYLFLALVIGIWFYGYFRKKKSYTHNITPSFVIFFLAISFSWYLYTSTSGPFDKIVGVGNEVHQNLLTEFFSVGARGSTVESAVLGTAPSLLHDISRGLFFVTVFFIILGFVFIVFNREEHHFDSGYGTMLYFSVVMLLAVVVIPNVAASFRMERFYNILLVFLSPLFVLGIKTLQTYFLKSRKKVTYVALVMAILIPFFLFQTGFVYEIAMDPYPTTPAFSMNRMGNIPYTNLGYVRRSSVFGATWLSKNAILEDSRLYADLISRSFVLRSYGHVPDVSILFFSNETIFFHSSYIFLSIYNEQIISRGGIALNITSFGFISNSLYSNGGSELYFVVLNSTAP